MPKVPNEEQLELRRRADGRLSASGTADPEMPPEILRTVDERRRRYETAMQARR